MIIETPYGEKCPNKDITKTSYKTCKNCEYKINLAKTFSICRFNIPNMTSEQKRLLLVDLSQRLPYGLLVKTQDHSNPQVVESISNDLEVIVQKNLGYSLLWEAKAYLRSLSSMTEEEFEEWTGLLIPSGFKTLDGIKAAILVDEVPKASDFLNSHQFDYRGLISMGLVLEAPEGMYNIK